jgi:hypothetical protein
MHSDVSARMIHSGDASSRFCTITNTRMLGRCQRKPWHRYVGISTVGARDLPELIERLQRVSLVEDDDCSLRAYPSGELSCSYDLWPAPESPARSRRRQIEGYMRLPSDEICFGQSPPVIGLCVVGMLARLATHPDSYKRWQQGDTSFERH